MKTLTATLIALGTTLAMIAPAHAADTDKDSMGMEEKMMQDDMKDDGMHKGAAKADTMQDEMKKEDKMKDGMEKGSMAKETKEKGHDVRWEGQVNVEGVRPSPGARYAGL